MDRNGAAADGWAAPLCFAGLAGTRFGQTRKLPGRGLGPRLQLDDLDGLVAGEPEAGPVGFGKARGEPPCFLAPAQCEAQAAALALVAQQH